MASNITSFISNTFARESNKFVAGQLGLPQTTTPKPPTYAEQRAQQEAAKDAQENALITSLYTGAFVDGQSYQVTEQLAQQAWQQLKSMPKEQREFILNQQSTVSAFFGDPLGLLASEIMKDLSENKTKQAFKQTKEFMKNWQSQSGKVEPVKMRSGNSVSFYTGSEESE